ncbi:Type 1 glutamine amidotransferase-like domain-containing protein [Candidatus Saccharibacteria bacterium]|nr:Type 1 glutamine amidotransferase-like domain-containing protein [Candidatus Saccharibacteria bacterium]
MRLYLSSYKLGNKPEEMLTLIGDNKRTAIIANAQDSKSVESRTERVQQEIESLTALGLQPEELDLRDYFGKTAELADKLNDYGYIWVRGGNVFILRKAYEQSGFDNLIVEMLKKDKIAYGGFSAGVCVLAPSLRGIELVDPKDEIAEGYDKEVIWSGLGLLDYAVAPHYRSDHPESQDIEKCVEYFKTNNIPYKTLRDGEAIVINGDQETLLA